MYIVLDNNHGAPDAELLRLVHLVSPTVNEVVESYTPRKISGEVLCYFDDGKVRHLRTGGDLVTELYSHLTLGWSRLGFVEVEDITFLDIPLFT